MVLYAPMNAADCAADLVEHLERTTGLTHSKAIRVVEDMLAYFAETAEEFITRRHRELQGDGLKNEAIFSRIEAELSLRRFAAPRFTSRQIRRFIYG